MSRAGLIVLAVLAAALLGAALWGGEALSLGAARSQGLAQADIDAIGVSPSAGARADLSLPFTDAAGRRITLGAALGGRPGVVIFADYSCTNLCGPALALTTVGLRASGLTPERDFRLTVVGLNPRDGGAVATKMGKDEIGSTPLAAATTLLLADPASTPALARAFGYRYRYDAAHNQFAHPVAAFVLTREGKLTRALSEIGLTGRDLRLALTEAGGGAVGGVGDQIRLHCYGFDVVSGFYDRGVSALVKIGALMILSLLAAFLVPLGQGVRRREQAA